MRVLVTGFGPFPGIPVNPSAALARYLVGHRRVRYAGLVRQLAVLPTEWSMLDDIGRLLADSDPDLILMFGVAGRRRKMTPEGRLVPFHARLKPDAAGRYPERAVRSGRLALQPDVALPLVLAALSCACVPARLSRDAGRYLCNALAYAVTEAAAEKRALALFVHIPLPRGRVRSLRGRRARPAPADLKRGAVAILDALLLQAHRRARAL